MFQWNIYDKNIVFWSPDEFAIEQIMTESSSMNHIG